MPQESQLLTLHTSLGDEALRFRGLAATEELGRLYEFVVHADSDDADIDPAKLLGTPAGVGMALSDGSRHFHGLIAAAGFEGATRRRFAWRLVLRPWLWLLTRRSDTRIFQAMTVKQVLEKVFDAYTHDVEFKLAGSYTPFEYCVQYRESDFNFVSRLMEQEGIYYYFRHEAKRTRWWWSTR